ncbi:MAG: RNA-binding proteins (RRM domain) [Phormidesmis priestleyi Ana]|uniref:RNA-binding proteins (RRM domain) n=1 Tax=Phormidesmis priestleyi Ana TaxID=1666911 RepID=A0A0P7ZLI9_9CYAN|nr:MAG: RNA-binding proteins (RRM domain) [Phormidesmis priestleyi Ana]
MSVRLYFGNLPRDLEREAFEAIFTEDTDNLVSVKLISDRKTGKCRGFGFVTAKTDEIADALVEKYNGFSLQESTLKVEKAMPRTEKEEDATPRESSGASDNQRNKSKKGGSRRGGNTTVVSETQTAAAEPDPRWAQDLAKLKEMLAAQTTPS